MPKPRSLARGLFGTTGLALLLTAGVAASAADAPATRPGGTEARERVPRPLRELRQAVDVMDLTDAQRPGIDAAFAGAEAALAEALRDGRDGDPKARREAVRTVFAGLVDEVNARLTPEQKPLFRQAVERLRGGGPAKAERPTTMPFVTGTGGPPARQLQRARDALAAMELSPETRGKVDGAFADLMEAVKQAKGEATPEAMRRALAQYRETLADALTPEQQRDLRQRLAGDAPAADEMNMNPATAGDKAARRQQRRRDQGERGQPGQQEDEPAHRSAFLQHLSKPAGLAVGAAVPENVTVVNLAGAERPLVRLLPKNRPLVVVFGSLSSPTFRDRLGDLPWLKQQLLGKADLMVLYTREQYPAGGWTVKRNDLDGVSIPPHADAAARMALLRKAVAAASDLDGVTWVADAMDDAALLTLVGDAPNCAAVVIRPDGTVAGRQQWLDPTGVLGLIE